MSNPAGWKCDACRRSGLESKRRCGWLPKAAPERGVVWARKHASTRTCPKSFITAQSLTWIEQFLVWRNLGYQRDAETNARDLEAFLLLQHELNLEIKRGSE